MEKLFNPYDKECMRMAILKHEETFREQVYELHRLYQIQKLLMKNIASSRNKPGPDSDRIRSSKIIAPESLIQTNDHHQDIHEKPRQCFDLELPGDEAELELTLGLGPTRRKALETYSIYSDSAASFSSSSTGSSQMMKRTDSANLGVKNANKEELIGGWQWRSLDHLHGSSPGGTVNVVGGGRKKQDRHTNPPWLLQALSLNTT